MKKTTKWMVSLIACAAMMSAATAQADEAYLELRSASTMVGAERMSPLIEDESTLGAGVVLGYELTLDEISGIAAVRALGIYGFDSANGEPFGGDVVSRWERHRLMAGTDVVFDAFGTRVQPLARLGAGYSQQALSITADNAEYRDTSKGFSAEAAGGLEVAIMQADPDGTAFSDNLSLGLNLLVGYSFFNSAGFHEMERQTASEEEHQHALYDAGSLNASGMSMSFGLVGSFRLGR